MTDRESGPRRRPPSRDQVLAWAVPAVLVAVALLQLGRAHLLDQSSWSGAGFGMFATYESEATRFVLLEVEAEDGSTRTVPAPAGPSTRAALVVPTRAALREVVDEARSQVDGAIRGATVWAIRFDADSGQVEPYVLARSGPP